MDVQIPENQAVLAYLLRAGPRPLLTLPERANGDPYLEMGSHPDIVGRVWDELGVVFSPDCPRIVCGSPALVHPGTGVVFALALGTRYVLRLCSDLASEAKRKGLRGVHTWSDGTITDIEAELGTGWIFGNWSHQEISWLKQCYLSDNGPA